MKVWIVIFLTIFFLICRPIPSVAGILSDRLNQYPQWTSKPSVQEAKGDLIYPNWMEGTWKVTSILIDKVAPFAPEIVTPGFDNSGQYLNQPIEFQVCFDKNDYPQQSNSFLPILIKKQHFIVANRQFNGLNIAKAYLGDQGVLSIKVDPKNSNRQITLLPENRQIIYTVTQRASETPTTDQFIATEITQQIFRSDNSLYLNEVETTTAYKLLESGDIKAQQITAIYLSPKDRNYFKAGGSPVALYRYQLQLQQQHIR